MKWLLNIAVGPVGRFIAAGRRSRDLWWGSTWLSECSLKVAEHLANHLEKFGGEMLVPSPARIEHVVKARSREAQYGDRISNHLLALVEADDAGAIRKLADAAQHEARAHLVGRLETNWDIAQDKVGNHANDLFWKGAFEAQRDAIRDHDDFLEFFAVWTPADPANLSKALERVDVLMNARKSARLFTTPPWQDAGLRKSDLDPGRPTVLKDGRDADSNGRDSDARKRARRLRLRLGIRPNEDLDAVGLSRRMANFGQADEEQGPKLARLPFPPLSRVAVDPWIHGVHRDASAKLADLRQAIGQAADTEQFSVWCSHARDPERVAKDPSAIFPFDASVLLEDGLSALEAEVLRALEKDSDEHKKFKATLDALQPKIEALHKDFGAPSGYVALLTMDGDGVGNMLHEAAQDVQNKLHPMIAALDHFAKQVPGIIRGQNGCAFYAAGDELLAFLPVDRVLFATEKIAAAFTPVSDLAASLNLSHVSLSGGVVIAHLKHDLRALRDAADKALGAAKGRRAGAEGWLELRELPRSGVARSCQAPLGALVRDLRLWCEGIREEKLSMRTAEKIHTFAERFDDGTREGGALGLSYLQSALLSQQVRGEILHDATLGATPHSRGEVLDALEQRIRRLDTWANARGLATELLIARRLFRVAQQRDPRGEV